MKALWGAAKFVGYCAIGEGCEWVCQFEQIDASCYRIYPNIEPFLERAILHFRLHSPGLTVAGGGRNARQRGQSDFFTLLAIVSNELGRSH